MISQPVSLSGQEKLIRMLIYAILIPSALLNAGGKRDLGKDMLKSVTRSGISWEQAVHQDNYEIISGSLTASFGRFNFNWKLDGQGNALLVFKEATGSAVLPAMEKSIHSFVLSDGTTVLFQKREPLLNSPDPAMLQPLAVVPTSSLFSVFPSASLPPESVIDAELLSIKWHGRFNKNGYTWLPGTVHTSIGSVNFFWKQKSNEVPELVIFQNGGGAELPPIESNLYLWLDTGKGIAVFFIERFPLLGQGNCPYLVQLATVSASDLLSGFNMIAKQD